MLFPEEKTEIGIVADVEEQKGFPPLHSFGDRPRPILLVVLWPYTGLSYEDPEDLEVWK
jgi:hypothetical protein